MPRLQVGQSFLPQCFQSYKHSLECHNGEKFEVDVRIIAQCYGKPSTRLITEAVYIEELPKENSMNSKAEWTYIKLPRVEVV